MAHVFVSYKREDRLLVKEIVEFLRDAFSRDTFFYDPQIRAGEIWEQRLYDEIANCDLFIFCISTDALASKYCQDELRKAIEWKKPVLPMTVRPRPNYEVAPEDLQRELSKLQILDLSLGMAERGITAKLFEAVDDILDRARGGGKPKPQPPGAAPDSRTPPPVVVIPAPPANPTKQITPLDSMSQPPAPPRPKAPMPDTETVRIPAVTPSPPTKSKGIPWTWLAAGLLMLALLIIITATGGFGMFGAGSATRAPFAGASTATQTPAIVAVPGDTATQVPSPASTATVQPSVTDTHIIVSTATPSPVAALAASSTPLPTVTPVPTAMTTPSPTPTATFTPSPTPTATDTSTPTLTPSPTLTLTPTLTPSPTLTLTLTPTLTPSPTLTLTLTPTLTPSPTLTLTPTLTPSPILTLTLTPTLTPTPAPTATPSPTLRPIIIGVAADTRVTANLNWSPIIRTFDGIEMALVPKGCFEMGRDDGQEYERPAHTQCIDLAYWIMLDEMTRDLAPLAEGRGGATSRNASWFDASLICGSFGMRLPTEREWEYAARGPSGWLYPWGQRFDTDSLINLDDSERAQPVRSAPDDISWVGAYDLAGNSPEWTSSVYLPYPYVDDLARENPFEARERVVRGLGVRSNNANVLTATYRVSFRPETTVPQIGFRCVRDYAESDLMP